MRIIQIISGILIALSIPFLIHSIFKRRKRIREELLDVPPTLLVAAAGLLSWGLFVTPKDFSGRGEFGVWLMGQANLYTPMELLTNLQAPLYMWGVRFFSFVFDGISFVFVANVTTVLFILGGVLIFFVAKNFLNSRRAGYIASFLYLFNPMIYFYSLTEEYVLVAIFFFILALFFASLYLKTEDEFFMLPAILSALLSAGSRFEYIFVLYFIILFYLLFASRNNFKSYIKKAALLFLIALPRTIVTAQSYLFNSAQQDVGLFEELHSYDGSLLPYLWGIFVDNYFSMLENLHTVRNLFYFSDLTGIVLVGGILSVIIFAFKKEPNQRKKTVFFFLFQMISIMIFYNFFDQVDGIMGYRYGIVIIMIATILSAATLDIFTKIAKPISSLFILGFVFSSIFMFILPLGFENYEQIVDPGLRGYVRDASDYTFDEYQKYDNLTYDNRLNRLLGDDEFIIDTKPGNTYFISNADRTLLHVMPVHGRFLAVWEKEELKRHYDNIPEDAKIYVSQSEMGFVSEQPDGYDDLPTPDQFQELVKDNFEIEREIISYEKDGYPFFLYEVSK